MQLLVTSERVILAFQRGTRPVPRGRARRTRSRNLWPVISTLLDSYLAQHISCFHFRVAIHLILALRAESGSRTRLVQQHRLSTEPLRYRKHQKPDSSSSQVAALEAASVVDVWDLNREEAVTP